MFSKKVQVLFFVVLCNVCFAQNNLANLKYAVSLIEVIFNSYSKKIRVTWMDTDDSTVWYHVYRYTDPITSESILSKCKLLGTVKSGVQNFEDELDEPGKYYYAVITFKENRELPYFMVDQSFSGTPLIFKPKFINVNETYATKPIFSNTSDWNQEKYEKVVAAIMNNFWSFNTKLASENPTELQKKFFLRSPEAKQYLESFESNRSSLLSQNYSIKCSLVATYDLDEKGFRCSLGNYYSVKQKGWIDIENKIFNPKISYKIKDVSDTNMLGINVSGFFLIPTSEEEGVEIERSKNVSLFLFFNGNNLKNIKIEEVGETDDQRTLYLVVDKCRLVMVDTVTGKIYFDKNY